MKFGGWITMITGMILFLTFIGFPTSFSLILNAIGLTDFTTGISLQLSTVYVTILAAITAIAVGGVIIGFFSKGYDTSQVIAPVIVILTGIYVPSFVLIINKVAGQEQVWLTAMVTILFATLGVGFVMSAMDYFGNR